MENTSTSIATWALRRTVGARTRQAGKRATRDSEFAYVTDEQSGDVSVVYLPVGKAMAKIPVGRVPRKIVIQPMSIQHVARRYESRRDAAVAWRAL